MPVHRLAPEPGSEYLATHPQARVGRYRMAVLEFRRVDGEPRVRIEGHEIRVHTDVDGALSRETRQRRRTGRHPAGDLRQ